ncbi:G5 domain-containing protein [Micromonospora sp. NPDC048909]|uniref:G5 domain-containing protein n=1 Tax=Micromonospora sp. NPDC048909 TaxID=3155643 RepID=UPI0033FEA2C9
MTYQPPQDPWQEPAPPPPPPPPHQPPAAYGAVPPYPTAQFPVAAGSANQQLQLARPRSKTKLALLAGAVLLLLCCGGVTVAAIVSPPNPDSKNAAGTSPSPTGEGSSVAAAADDIAATEPSTAVPPTSVVATPSAAAAPDVQTRTVTQTQKIDYKTKTINDASLPKGTKKITTRGVPGVRTLTYEVTITDGVQTAKKLTRSEVTKAPVTQVVRIGTKRAPAATRTTAASACPSPVTSTAPAAAVTVLPTSMGLFG